MKNVTGINNKMQQQIFSTYMGNFPRTIFAKCVQLVRCKKYKPRKIALSKLQVFLMPWNPFYHQIFDDTIVVLSTKLITL